MAVPLFILFSKEWEFMLLHILASTCCYQLFLFLFFLILAISNKCIVVFIVVLSCISLLTCWVKFICLLYIFFGEVSVQIFCPFLSWSVFAYCWVLSGLTDELTGLFCVAQCFRLYVPHPSKNPLRCFLITVFWAQFQT